jgi:transposase-like protein
MAGKAGMSYALSDEEMRGAVDALVSEGNISAAARKLGIHRASLINRLKRAEEAGISGPRRTQANPSRWRPGDEIVAARKAEFERLEASVRYDGNIIHRPDNGPFAIFALGDEHLDNPGTDLKLWERWIGFLDRAKHVTGWSMGDVLDNWVKPLAFLYGTAQTTAPEGWILLEHYMEQIGEHLDVSVGGNHDSWNSGENVLAAIMQRHGVLHRGNSARVRYRCPSGREITVHGRHSWPGRSMWSEVHALKRAARMGIRDTILLGGHTHVSGESVEKDPVTGRYTFVYQVASFKLIDDYADTLGLLDRHTSPAIALVIDPRRPDNDPELVKHFFAPEPAADYLAFLRRRT